MRIERWDNTVDYPDYIGDELFCRVDYTRTLTEDVKISETFSNDFAITPVFDQEHVPSWDLIDFSFDWTSCTLEPGTISGFNRLNLTLEKNGKQYIQSYPIAMVSGLSQTVATYNGVEIGDFDSDGRFAFWKYFDGMGLNTYVCQLTADPSVFKVHGLNFKLTDKSNTAPKTVSYFCRSSRCPLIDVSDFAVSGDIQSESFYYCGEVRSLVYYPYPLSQTLSCDVDYLKFVCDKELTETVIPSQDGNRDNDIYKQEWNDIPGTEHAYVRTAIPILILAQKDDTLGFRWEYVYADEDISNLWFQHLSGTQVSWRRAFMVRVDSRLIGSTFTDNYTMSYDLTFKYTGGGKVTYSHWTKNQFPIQNSVVLTD